MVPGGEEGVGVFAGMRVGVFVGEGVGVFVGTIAGAMVGEEVRVAVGNCRVRGNPCIGEWGVAAVGERVGAL
eukprot:CAMPEP_0194499736 /NCGR_PEP_ID=MMETSP0253-20130528/15950_1 /TAXON_ID=2966 /ORGANISM="Noctiluca scintillans" /LENGTH=71 /DNA_ID=CAMNT_0039341513 /DNA_START=224 /DNA_END=435 /DNA_ORIENTATION=+